MPVQFIGIRSLRTLHLVSTFKEKTAFVKVQSSREYLCGVTWRLSSDPGEANNGCLIELAEPLYRQRADGTGNIRSLLQGYRDCFQRALFQGARTLVMPLLKAGYTKEEQWQAARQATVSWGNRHANFKLYLLIEEGEANPENTEAMLQGYEPLNLVPCFALYEEGFPASRTIQELIDIQAYRDELLPSSYLKEGQAATFTQRLLQLIDESGRTDADVYRHANIDRKLFSKIRSNRDYHPKKTTVLALAISLHLDEAGTRELLDYAGYSLSQYLKLDVIVLYFIRRKQYDIWTINEALAYFGQPNIGC